MSWSTYAPSLIAMLGIPLAAMLTWWREDRLRTRQERREDMLASRRYQEWVSQRWWERKADTYIRIMEALWNLLEYAREAEEELWAHRTGEAKQASRASRDFRQSREELKKTADIGSFVISEEAASSLRVFFRTVNEASNHPDYDMEIQLHLKAAETCMTHVREEALRDLGLVLPY